MDKLKHLPRFSSTDLLIASPADLGIITTGIEIFKEVSFSEQTIL